MVGLGYGWKGYPSTNTAHSTFNTRDGGIFSIYIDVSGTADVSNHIGECSRLSGYCFQIILTICTILDINQVEKIYRSPVGIFIPTHGVFMQKLLAAYFIGILGTHQADGMKFGIIFVHVS